jgi:hypothetical protein
MAKRKKVIGKGAVVSSLARMLHPSKAIIDRFINMNAKKRLDNMIVINQRNKTINKTITECIVVQSNDVMEVDQHIVPYAAKRYFKVVVEGPKENFFFSEAEVVEEEDIEEEAVLPEDVCEMVCLQTFDTEDLHLLQSLVEFDNNNNPAPKNVHDAVNNDVGVAVYEPSWQNHDGQCQRVMSGASKLKPQLLFPKSTKPSLVDLFEMLFPKDHVEHIMLPEINKKIESGLVHTASS